MKALIITQTYLLFALFSNLVSAQNSVDLPTLAKNYINQQSNSWNLTPPDTKDVIITDYYQTQHNKVTHLYFQQRYQGIKIFNAITGIHIKNNKVVFATPRFLSNLKDRINTTKNTISQLEAIQLASKSLRLSQVPPLQLLEKKGSYYFKYAGSTLSRKDIEVELLLFPVEKGQLKLVWSLAIDLYQNEDDWTLQIDAQTGELLNQFNNTLHCSFPDATSEDRHTGELSLSSPKVSKKLSSVNLTNTNNAQYNVFPVPLESPIHGDREIVNNPSNPVASPHGWHDIDGIEGPEFTITKGNNVHAFLDLNDDDSPSEAEPNGGENLIFDAPFNINDEPENYREASVIQLFYMNNFMHDFSYLYGFDEAAGNYQQNNYGKPGAPTDYIEVNGQDGADILDSDHLNNANFNVTRDGIRGRMQMYLYNRPGGQIFKVNTPEEVAGSFDARKGNFGANITSSALTAEVAIVDDGSSLPTLGCDFPINSSDLNGKFALIDRGSCQFGLKSLNAQLAGAIGVIICNYEDALVTMGPGLDGDAVNIPVISVKQSDCQIFRQFAGDGLTVTFQLPEDSGPGFRDGGMDNGIVAHEYAHGISTRLTGGPNNSTCLGNDEQMGEGWSDFFHLVTSVQADDVGEMPKGHANYASGDDINGAGVRRRPYTTDFSINDFTYEDIITAGGQSAPPHPVGEVWATMLWDLYWKFVEVYGWDEDLLAGNGGNNMAIQLVMDGMKLQACSPGFINGRDAILQADSINYNGANQCIIWEVFAKRGLGFSADQGSINSRNDGKEAFDTRPECLNKIDIKKTVPPMVEAGDQIIFLLTITNYMDEVATDVIVTDELPEGLTYVNSSVSGATELSTAEDKLTLGLGDMAPMERKLIFYRAITDPTKISIEQFFDDMEAPEDNWDVEFEKGLDIWNPSEDYANSGTSSWFIENLGEENDQRLFLREPIIIEGQQPVLRFYHFFNISPGFDGGFLEVSTDNGINWTIIPDEKIFKNKYSGPISPLLLGLSGLRGFYGRSTGFVDTYVDLRDYKGEEIRFRFRFVSDDQIGSIGWAVDDVEFMDMVNYDGEACVWSNESDTTCVKAPFGGTIIQSEISTNTTFVEPERLEIDLLPNPAKDQVNLGIKLEETEIVNIQFIDSNGHILKEKRFNFFHGYNQIPINISDLPIGFYVVRVIVAERTAIKKMVKN